MATEMREECHATEEAQAARDGRRLPRREAQDIRTFGAMRIDTWGRPARWVALNYKQT